MADQAWLDQTSLLVVWEAPPSGTAYLDQTSLLVVWEAPPSGTAYLDQTSCLVVWEAPPSGTAYLDQTSCLVVWEAGVPVAVVPDISGAPTVLATFDGSGSQFHQYYAWEWTSLPGGSALSNFPKPLPDNAVGSLMAGNEGLYHFEGNADDSSGNARNGTVSNAVQVTGKVGSNAYQFNRSATTYVTLGGVTDYHFTTGNFTICGWFKPAATQDSYAPLFSCLGGGGWGSNTRGYWVFQDNNNHNNYRIGIRHGTTYSLGTNFSLTADVWNHVAIIKDGGTYKAYVNGTEVASDVMNATINQTSNNSALIIARNGLGYTGSMAWDGDIDEFAIWSRALSPTEIGDIYDQQSKTGLGISTATAAFTPDIAGTYTVQLTVADGVSVTADAVIGTSGPENIDSIFGISKDNIGTIMGIIYGDIDKINDID